MATYKSQQNNMEQGMRNYCNSVRPDRTQFDKNFQNMWCPSCCGPTGPTGPTGPNGSNEGPNTARYSSAVEDMDFRGNVNVAGVN